MLRPGVRTAYNPFEELTQPWAIYTFIAFRMVGLSLLVPVAEEIFWRGFLARWLISEDWQDVKLGTYTPSSFWYVVGMFYLGSSRMVCSGCLRRASQRALLLEERSLAVHRRACRQQYGLRCLCPVDRKLAIGVASSRRTPAIPTLSAEEEKSMIREANPPSANLEDAIAWPFISFREWSTRRGSPTSFICCGS